MVCSPANDEDPIGEYIVRMVQALFAAIEIHFFAVAMLFGALASICAFFVLYRMRSLGFFVGIFRWPGRDFQLYSGYWKIAPKQGWSRLPILIMPVAFVIGVIFLFLSRP
jgi:hypothetical protein